MKMKLEKPHAHRRRAGRRIDPETAEVDWDYAETLDPYGILDLPEEDRWSIGREYFGRYPRERHLGLLLRDLTAATRAALWARHEKNWRSLRDRENFGMEDACLNIALQELWSAGIRDVERSAESREASATQNGAVNSGALDAPEHAGNAERLARVP